MSQLCPVQCVKCRALAFRQSLAVSWDPGEGPWGCRQQRGLRAGAAGRTLPCGKGGKGAGNSSVCLSDKSSAVYLNPQCFFICLFKSFPAKKEQKEEGKLPLLATLPQLGWAWGTSQARAGLGPGHPALLQEDEGMCFRMDCVPIF